MRYLIDPEFRKPKAPPAERRDGQHAAKLRQELSHRNLAWARTGAHTHEVSLGSVPSILYRENDCGEHGNFLPATYARIGQTPAWARRLKKTHTTAHRALLSRDRERCELDSCNSSDALLMNIFCHPETLSQRGVQALLGTCAEPEFGFRPGVPFQNGRRDRTEIDMKLGDLLVEAKLTEYDFQAAPRERVERYRDLEIVFDLDKLQVTEDSVHSYQLVRGVLAAYDSPGARYCVFCDARRPDLIADWHRVVSAVVLYDLRCRLQLLTWQELFAVLPDDLQIFLRDKFGITKA